jgi:hypothetical protein
MYIQNIVRDSDLRESIQELDSCAGMGEEFYQESGQLFKWVGVLRALDVLWNSEKRQVQILEKFDDIFCIKKDNCQGSESVPKCHRSHIWYVTFSSTFNLCVMIVQIGP